VVDSNHRFTDALTWMDQFKEGMTIPVSNLDDMVRACTKAAIAKSRAIEFLAIFGHGCAGYQAVGAGRDEQEAGSRAIWWQSVVSRGQSELVGPAERKISGLNGVLSSNATILLGGCNVGEGDYGAGLLKAVSRILKGRRVQAFENKVFWWSGYMVGPLKQAQGDNVSSSMSIYTIAPPLPILPSL
jgi:hypothetical protein